MTIWTSPEADTMAGGDAVAFKQAMQRFPSGVVIATTCSRAGEPRGFTASSFTSVSMNPALILVCLSRSAECHEDFSSADWFAINLLRPEHEALAVRFGTRGADKFTGDTFAAGPNGLPVLGDALAQLICRKQGAHDCGDHTVLIGQVESIRFGREGEAMARYQGRFAAVGAGVFDAA